MVVALAFTLFIYLLIINYFFTQLDFRVIQPFLSDCRDTIAKLDNQNMKAIRGLEDRLYTLDQMIATCKKLVHEQKELAQVHESETSVLLRLSVLSFFSGLLRHFLSICRDSWPIRSGLKT